MWQKEAAAATFDPLTTHKNNRGIEVYIHTPTHTHTQELVESQCRIWCSARELRELREPGEPRATYSDVRVQTPDQKVDAAARKHSQKKKEEVVAMMTNNLFLQNNGFGSGPQYSRASMTLPRHWWQNHRRCTLHMVWRVLDIAGGCCHWGYEGSGHLWHQPQTAWRRASPKGWGQGSVLDSCPCAAALHWPHPWTAPVPPALHELCKLGLCPW